MSKPKPYQHQDSKPKLQNQVWFWCMPNLTFTNIEGIRGENLKMGTSDH
jgi:hypothetical protein